MKILKKIFTPVILLSLIVLLGGLLRFYNLGHNPVSLYWDEASIGLEAYSVATTGKDTNGLPWLQSIFPAYGDFKAPVQIWLVTPFVKIFGLSETIVRLPSAILGTLTILLVYLLTKELIPTIKKQPQYKQLPLITAALTAIIPWASHFSRIGFESNISVFFYVLSLLFFAKALKKSGIYFIAASITAAIGVYAYYSLRLIYPCMFLILGITQIKIIWKKKWTAIIAIILFIILNIPIFTNQFYQESQEYRLSDNSLLTTPKLVQESSSYLETYHSALWSRIVYHRSWFYLRDFSQNYLSHFTNDFLFITGDQQLRQHSDYGGELFPILSIFFYIGLFFIFKNYSSKLSIFTIAMLVTAPIPAAFKYEIPNASRSIYMYVPLVIITSIGMIHLVQLFKHQLLTLLTIIAIITAVTFNATLYYLDYFIEYPKRSAIAWLYPYKQAAQYIEKHYQEFSTSKISGHYWFPDIIVFYQFPYLAPYIQDMNFAIRTNSVNSFGYPDWNDYLFTKENGKPEVYLIREQEAKPEYYTIIDRLYLPDGRESLQVVRADVPLKILTIK